MYRAIQRAVPKSARTADGDDKRAQVLLSFDDLYAVVGGLVSDVWVRLWL